MLYARDGGAVNGSAPIVAAMNSSLSRRRALVAARHRRRSCVIRGGRPLVGTYPISGAKNAALPLMVSALLTPHLVTLRNVPGNLDVAVLAALLQRLGCEMHWSSRCGRPRRDDLGRSRAAQPPSTASWSRACAPRSCCSAPCWRAAARRVCRCRAATLSACAASTSMSRACAPWAPRSALDGGTIEATAPRRPARRRHPAAAPSVGATENLLLAAVLASGRTTIRNAACEPEVADLATCLDRHGRRDRRHRHPSS